MWFNIFCGDYLEDEQVLSLIIQKNSVFKTSQVHLNKTLLTF